MCGISLLVESGAPGPILDRLREMHARVPHRGPDGEGWLAVDASWTPTATATEAALRDAVGGRPLRLAGAFRWLRIQNTDPSSCQPMGSPPGDVWLLFNGEIYNHCELRRELQAHGVAFRTSSDTEALLNAYLHWGPQCFERLNGMWGAVIVDTRRRQLVVSRDRFGIRPLFYRFDGGRLAIGSEAKQIAWSAGERPTADAGAVLGFLAGRRLGCEETYFTGVRAVPPASAATIPFEAPATDVRFARYWTLDGRAAAGQPSSLSEASSRLEHLLQDAVALQAVAAVPVGALLSGGLDSSVLSALLVESRRRHGQPTSLVSVTADGVTGSLDERPYMRAMAEALAGDDVAAVESPIDAAYVDASMDRVTWHQEEPIAGVALVAHDRAFQATASLGVRVALEGTGSDEILAGYPRHQMAAIRDHFGRRELIAGARELTGALRHDGEVFGPWLRDFVSQTVRRRVGSRAAARPGWMARNLPPAEGAPAPDGAAAGLSALARMSRADLTSGNIPAVLALTDRNAMAHSVESRVPFLDHRIVEFGLALPDRFKASRGARKVVLRDLARRRLPAVIAGRGGRIGFGMPLAEWLRGPLRPGVLETVTGPGVMSHTVFDAGATLRFVTDFLDGRHEDAASVWRIVAVARWLQKFRIEM